MDGVRNVYKILVRKSRGKRQFEKPRYKVKYNSKINICEMSYDVKTALN
jgi:hypothetical protein